jgi:hypothetical protein
VEEDDGTPDSAQPAAARASPSTRPPEERSKGSIRPSAPPPSLGTGPSHNGRIVFAALWIIVQAALVITADRRTDGAFGFRMFNESSTIKIALYREVDGPDGQSTRVHVEGGVWSAQGPDGMVHRLTWYDRVPMPYWVFDQEMHASYGSSTQLGRLRAALEDVASHVPDDTETRRLILEVTVRRNGREPVVRRLISHERALPRPGSAGVVPEPPKAHEAGGP